MSARKRLPGCGILLSALARREPHATAHGDVAIEDDVEGITRQLHFLTTTSGAAEVEASIGEVVPLSNQVPLMHRMLAPHRNVTGLEHLCIRQTNLPRQTLCFYAEQHHGERTPRGEDLEERCLFSCDHLLTSVAGQIPPMQCDAAFGAPILIVDDRYGADGFWDLLTSIIRRGVNDFHVERRSVQLQMLAVPVVEREGESGFTIDLLQLGDAYRHTDATNPSQPPPSPSNAAANSANNNNNAAATRHNISDLTTLESSLHENALLAKLVGKEVGVSHLVVYLSFINMIENYKYNLCVVCLRDDENYDHMEDDELLSAEVLRYLVEELTLAAGEISSTPRSARSDHHPYVFDEAAVHNAFQSTRLTSVLQGVMQKNYAACASSRAPLFQWLCHLPAGRVEESVDDQHGVLTTITYPPYSLVDEAMLLLMDMQGVNLQREDGHERASPDPSQPCDSVAQDGSSTTATAAATTAAPHSSASPDATRENSQRTDSISQRRKKINVRRLYERIDASSGSASRCSSISSSREVSQHSQRQSSLRYVSSYERASAQDDSSYYGPDHFLTATTNECRVTPDPRHRPAKSKRRPTKRVEAPIFVEATENPFVGVVSVNLMEEINHV